jgi:hypothetical protein
MVSYYKKKSYYNQRVVVINLTLDVKQKLMKLLELCEGSNINEKVDYLINEVQKKLDEEK